MLQDFIPPYSFLRHTFFVDLSIGDRVFYTRSNGMRVPPYGPWEHIPAHVWTAPTQEDNDNEDVVGDEGDVCALCCTKSDPEKMSMCDKCELQYCTDCIDTHTCDNVTFL